MNQNGKEVVKNFKTFLSVIIKTTKLEISNDRGDQNNTINPIDNYRTLHQTALELIFLSSTQGTFIKVSISWLIKQTSTNCR